MEYFTGYLFSKLHLIGSKSEGPSYFLQQFNYQELPILKKSPLWMEDENLQRFLGRKVVIEGCIKEGKIHYEKASWYDTGKIPIPEEPLNLGLTCSPSSLESFQSSSNDEIEIQINFSVEWPFRSIWSGVCPTSQLYEFLLLEDDEIIMKWSDDKVFSAVWTPVRIPGGSPEIYKENLIVKKKALNFTKKHLIRAVFISSNQEIEKEI